MMRVDYTLPALQSGNLLEAEPAAEGVGRSFREQLRGTTASLPVNWEQQLRLDVRPLTATFVGPPPRPRTLELSDAETERARWRNMVLRHSRSLGTTGSFTLPTASNQCRPCFRCCSKCSAWKIPLFTATPR